MYVRVLAAVAGLGVVAWTAVQVSSSDDLVEEVRGVELGSLTVAAVDDATDDRQTRAPGGVAAEGERRVPGLETIAGVFTHDGEAGEDFRVGDIEVDFGPEAWVLTAGPTEDIDRDGAREDLLAELEGLVGVRVSLLVRPDDGGEEAEVYRIGEVGYRDPAGGIPPWLQAPKGAAAATPQEIADAAVVTVGDGARVDELEREQAGDVAWAAEVEALDGREWDVLLDVTGAVLDVRLDD